MSGIAAMPGTAPEFSRLVPLARLGFEPFRQEIEAGEAERAALAQRLDLVSLDTLHASVELVRQGQDRILLRAGFEAAFVQSCVVTLDPVPGTLKAEFTLIYGPPEIEAEAAGGVEDDAAFEPLSGQAIDIGEAVAQELALALPPFPRHPEADAAAPSADGEGSPFAGLAALLERGRRG
ncbi:MAG: YceD family protein [Thiohalocapsa sp.]